VDIDLYVSSSYHRRCVGADTETTAYTEDEMEVPSNMPEDEEDQWCLLNTTRDDIKPQTGEALPMEIIGKETVDGIEMCKGMAEIKPAVDGIANPR
jgi:hypothetical protein